MIHPDEAHRPNGRSCALDGDALRDYAAERLAAFKRPREIRFVDSLPRNALGKILKQELTRGLGR